MIAYRDAGPADAATLSAVSRRAFTETFGHLYRPDDLAAFLDRLSEAAWAAELADPRFTIRLAEDDGVAAGFAKLGPPSLPFEPRGPSAELRQLYVLAPWQGAGVAVTLMDWTIATARAQGAADLYLSVFIDNERAKRFYARYGFERIGTYAFMVGNQADEDDLMRLAL
ncbi:GNAT family N-acetyltransferase [Sphingomonas mollis]|uniref:GNAT family N-acetyltransferase n=1 Tax=Sphingomonas mollis TaxID=2795726 RepID=A0ABS0XRH6_9SPHN|nr:GNAT family N-acetyltransferase [Sphingomonas sp. BT553]MBJ6122642.1 GNAT family N-acetyltransferase [Sphingomonas sp. BT553]